MKNFKKLFVLLAIIVLSIVCAIGCKKPSNANSNPSSETNSEITSIESESVVKPTKAPTLSIDKMDSTINSINFKLSEDDPYDCGEITELYIGLKDEEPIYAQNTEQREFTNLYSNKLYFFIIKFYHICFFLHI